jgi:catechol 2,3-dioxygenase-like lactoylglutathione lyase family enzyme
MTKVIFGNDTAVVAGRSDQERILRFYCDVLGAKVKVTTDEVDRVQLGDMLFCFVYRESAPDESGFSKAIWLELKTDDVEEMRRDIFAFGVKTLDLPDPHFYFQAPGGQVFRMVGISRSTKSRRHRGRPRPHADTTKAGPREREDGLRAAEGVPLTQFGETRGATRP